MSKSIPVVMCMKNRLTMDGISQILRSEGHAVRAAVTTLDAVLKLKLNPRADFILLHSGSGRDLIDATMIRAVKERYRNCHVVLLLESCRHDQRWQVEQLGVSGVLLKSISREILVASLKLIALGEHVFSAQIAPEGDAHQPDLDEGPTSGEVVVLPSRAIDHHAPRAALPAPGPSTYQPKIARRSELSEREIEILACLVAGNSNKIIARLCNITEATVKAHLKAILRKTEVVNRTQAAIWALNNVDLNGRIPELRVSGD